MCKLFLGGDMHAINEAERQMGLTIARNLYDYTDTSSVLFVVMTGAQYEPLNGAP